MAPPTQAPSKLVELLSSNKPNLALEIVDNIISSLTIADVYRLHEACRALRWLVDYLPQSRRLLSINKHLGSFVQDAALFRRKLGEFQGLITGGFVRNFFEFGRWKVPCLDVFVELGSQADGFVKYLCDQEQYEAPEDDRERQEVILQKTTMHDRTIRVTQTNGIPILDIFTSSYTTADLNFITWNKAYSLFPALTIARHKFYPLSDCITKFDRVLGEYAQQGWTSRDLIWPDWTSENFQNSRRVGDSSSLVMLLGHCHGQGMVPDCVIEQAQFDAEQYFPESSRSNRMFRIVANPIQSISLRYRYTFGQDCCLWTWAEDAVVHWPQFLQQRLDRWAFIELLKTDPGQVPRPFSIGTPPSEEWKLNLPDDFQQPDTWEYADDQMSVWYREWEGGKDGGKGQMRCMCRI